MLFPLATIGCAEHHYYRVYDPYYHQYHRWDDERIYYRQWAIENHRDPNRDYRHLDREDQRRYWKWRHQHEHDRDRDHDRDHRG